MELEVNTGPYTVTDFSIGLSFHGTMPNGLLIISLPADEATYPPGWGTFSFHLWKLPYKVKNEGSVGRIAYSLYLNSENSDSETLLFGGEGSSAVYSIDCSKLDDSIDFEFDFGSIQL